MNIKQFSLQLGLGLALAIAGVVSQTPQVQAQTGNFSDVTGNIITTSDIAGGAFAPGSDGERRLVFRTNQIRDSVYGAAGEVNQQLAARNLPIVATGAPTAIPAEVQQDLECVLAGAGNVDACQARLVNDIVNAGANPTLTQNLVSSIRGLTVNGRVDPAQFTTAIQNYNALINASSFEALSSTAQGSAAQGLRAIQSVFSILLNAAYASG